MESDNDSRFPRFTYIQVGQLKLVKYDGISRTAVVPKPADRSCHRHFLVPQDLDPVPCVGDHLKLQLEPDSPQRMEYARRWENVSAVVTQIVHQLNGVKLAVLNTSMCCDLRIFRERGFRVFPEASYIVSLVESTQPNACTWRIWQLRRGNQIVPSNRYFASKYDDEFVLCEPTHMELGVMRYKDTRRETIRLTNGDPHESRCLQSVRVYGCPLGVDRLGLFQLSEVYTDGRESPLCFFPSIEFVKPKRVVKVILSGEGVCVDVQLSGRISGDWLVCVGFRFDTGVELTCHLHANVLDKFGKTSQDIVANPEIDSGNMRDERRCYDISRLRDIVQLNGLSALGDGHSHWPDFKIPQSLMEMLNIENRDQVREELHTKYPALSSALTIANYRERMHLLLHLEEHFKHLALRESDRILFGPITCAGHPRVYRFGMSGVVWEGDHMTVQCGTSENSVSYTGVVIEVEGDTSFLVLLNKIPEPGSFGNDALLNISFTLDRHVEIQNHIAVEVVNETYEGVLLPSVAYRNHTLRLCKTDTESTSSDIIFINPKLNAQQKDAVAAIVAGVCRPMPFLLSGPPGTGKSSTLLEAIHQIYLRDPSSRLLISAPNNTAVDNLGVLLLQSGVIQPSSLLRILSKWRDVKSTVPEILQPFCQNGILNRIEPHHRLVLITCCSAFFVWGVTFSHVLVDEAACATETEALIPIVAAAAAGSTPVSLQIILAGDPFQLGAVVRSELAIENGFQKSLLGRLLSLPAYQQDGKDCRHNSAKLRLNYRLTQNLLKLPSHLFYSGTLKTALCTNKTQRDGLWWLDGVTFWPIHSREQHEVASYSVANKGQAVRLGKLVHLLLTSGVLLQDIGIISPYRLQVERIRADLLQTFPDCTPQVGTVDEYQGKEKPVIILSTVRSRSGQPKTHCHNGLGFVGCPKRINVAISRAQRSLLIIGDPQTLLESEHWRAIIRFCYERNRYDVHRFDGRSFPCPRGVLRRRESRKEDIPLGLLSVAGRGRGESFSSCLKMFFTSRWFAYPFFVFSIGILHLMRRFFSF